MIPGPQLQQSLKAGGDPRHRHGARGSHRDGGPARRLAATVGTWHSRGAGRHQVQPGPLGRGRRHGRAPEAGCEPSDSPKQSEVRARGAERGGEVYVIGSFLRPHSCSGQSRPSRRTSTSAASMHTSPRPAGNRNAQNPLLVRKTHKRPKNQGTHRNREHPRKTSRACCTCRASAASLQHELNLACVL